MGSWDVSCSLTGLHIGCGDPAVLVPLIPRATTYNNELSQMRMFGNTNILSNEGADVYFQAATYPIFGEYADYGDIDNICRDDNTKVLEEYFGLSIEKIVTVLTDNRKSEIFYCSDMSNASPLLDMSNPRHVELSRYSVTWIHGEVYGKLAKLGGRECIDLGHPALLESLGFEFAGIDKKKDRYNQKFKKSGKILYSDGTWTHPAAYNLNSFEEYCRNNRITIDLAQLREQNYYEQSYNYKLIPDIKEQVKRQKFDIEIRESVLNRTDIEEDLRKQYLERETDLFNFSSRDEGYLVLYRDFTFKDKNYVDNLSVQFDKDVERRRSWTTYSDEDYNKVKEVLETLRNAEVLEPLSDVYAKKIVETEGFLKSNIVDWFTVHEYFFMLGKFLFPIGTSPQCGEPERVLEVLNIAKEICEKEITEYLEDMSEYE